MYTVQPTMSGDRFEVLYKLQGTESDALAKAKDICIEQTVEFPEDLLPAGDIPEQVIGRIVAFEAESKDSYAAQISFPVEAAGGDLIQLLNVIFGNISIKPGIRVEKLFLPESITSLFKGPRFGIAGLRKHLGVYDRPLLSTALKPMGLSAKDLADQAYRFAIGGIDLIKDDHGLANQPFAPFMERVARCAEAVHKANQETGGSAIYIASLGAPADQIMARALEAKACGVGGFLVMPGLSGFDTMRMLAEADEIGLPLISHPAFVGSYVTRSTEGISHYALFGQITRLTGADASIYPNYGGRFAFSRGECYSIVDGSRDPMGHLAPIFPAPGGGMTAERVPEMLDLYGRDVIFLIGGGIHRYDPDLVKSSRYFRSLLDQG